MGGVSLAPRRRTRSIRRTRGPSRPARRLPDGMRRTGSGRIGCRPSRWRTHPILRRRLVAGVPGGLAGWWRGRRRVIRGRLWLGNRRLAGRRGGRRHVLVGRDVSPSSCGGDARNQEEDERDGSRVHGYLLGLSPYGAIAVPQFREGVTRVSPGVPGVGFPRSPVSIVAPGDTAVLSEGCVTKSISPPSPELPAPRLQAPGSGRRTRAGLGAAGTAAVPCRKSGFGLPQTPSPQPGV